MKQEVFGDYAGYYNLLYRDKDYAAEAAYVEALVGRFRPGAKAWGILDVGCGTGRHAAAFAARGHAVVGIDASEQMVRLARQSGGPSVRFAIADARSFRLDERFPVAVSLFHVASYQTANADLSAYFKSVAEHLEPSGLFVFDFWYGPAVLHQKPEVRVRELEDDRLRIVRIARPVLEPEDDCVTVTFDLLIEQKPGDALYKLREHHRMRYLFLPEVRDLLERAGLQLVHAEEWITGRPLGLETWSACLLAARAP